MAEGGEEEELDNPFSFKAYVKKKVKPKETQNIDSDDIFSFTGSNTRKTDKPSLVVADDSGKLICLLFLLPC